MKLYLASTSPRRRELLKSLNISFEVIAPNFEEQPTGLSPDEEVLHFAEAKALSVEAQCPESLVLGSDTLITIEGIILGKPIDEADAVKMLQKLSTKTHILYTAVVLLNTKDKSLKKHLEEVKVTFRTLSEKEIKDYVVTGEPMDKAGAYAIQGGAKDFVTKVEGDLEAVIGLPLEPIRNWLGIT